MKVKVLLLVVSIASFLAALLCAQGIIPTRGGSDASGIIVTHDHPVSGGKPRPPGWF